MLFHAASIYGDIDSGNSLSLGSFMVWFTIIGTATFVAILVIAIWQDMQ